jgi:hypothetical protein
MRIEVTDEVLEADITLSAKFIAAAAMAYPMASRSELADKLGVDRSTVIKGIKRAKLGGVSFDGGGGIFATSGESATSGVSASKRGVSASKSGVSATPHPVDVCNKENQTADLPAAKKRSSAKTPSAPPTRKEVDEYAKSKGREDLVEGFFSRYDREDWQHNGEPLANWKRMFDAWARRAPATVAKKSNSISLEERLYELDGSY